MLPASKITIINILQRIGTLWRTASHASPQLGLGSSWPASVGARSTNRQCHVEGSAIHHPAALLSAGGWTQICFHYHYVLIYRTIYNIKYIKKTYRPTHHPTQSGWQSLAFKVASGLARLEKSWVEKLKFGVVLLLTCGKLMFDLTLFYWCWGPEFQSTAFLGMNHLQLVSCRAPLSQSLWWGSPWTCHSHDTSEILHVL